MAVGPVGNQGDLVKVLRWLWKRVTCNRYDRVKVQTYYDDTDADIQLDPLGELSDDDDDDDDGEEMSVRLDDVEGINGDIVLPGE
eukprot:CAMPEP_0168538830 /NCGR_PEP_ID=MMETSP0405-20121227/21429_1 /TAXON_ID=498012 /ORGANISM="Trichosphaerium sp, Strain Am-I-7 wt" /LENGTH=84 /DNA_ID=CAMNT_0008568203 /DNA_START=475 /DNA_END=726 /DNA_ORIENTATION=-